MTTLSARPRPWYTRPRFTVPLGILAVILIGALVSVLSPWPSALLIRTVFELDARATIAEASPHLPPDGTLESTLDVAYADDGVETSLDLYWPAGTTEPLPTVIWIHGGAWISGSKENIGPYAQLLAAHGYTTASLNYSVAPESAYPTAVEQLNAALAFLVEHADEYRIDPNRLVLAGDSAGAQLASQLATMVTNPSYAERVGIEPALVPGQLAGVILNCGIYDVSVVPNAPGIGGWGFRIALWSYLGTKDWSNTAGGELMSTIDDVTADFPATWISGGNADPLTPSQSRRMAERLSSLGVDVTELFWPDDYEPALGHEYQFHLDLAEAQEALDHVVAWLDEVTASTAG